MEIFHTLGGNIYKALAASGATGLEALSRRDSPGAPAPTDARRGGVTRPDARGRRSLGPRRPTTRWELAS
jgi:hypothetical protein